MDGKAHAIRILTRTLEMKSRRLPQATKNSRFASNQSKPLVDSPLADEDKPPTPSPSLNLSRPPPYPPSEPNHHPPPLQSIQNPPKPQSQSVTIRPPSPLPPTPKQQHTANPETTPTPPFPKQTLPSYLKRQTSVGRTPQRSLLFHGTGWGACVLRCVADRALHGRSHKPRFPVVVYGFAAAAVTTLVPAARGR